MGYKADREAFVYRMAREGWSIGHLREVLSLAGALQRGAEMSCSVPMNVEMSTAHDARMELYATRLGGIARTHGMRATCFGDCRGYVVHLFKPGENVETSLGIAVPGEGLRASQLARLCAR